MPSFKKSAYKILICKSSLIGTRWPFSRVKGLGLEVATQFFLVPRVRKSGAIPPLFLYSNTFMSCFGKKFNFKLQLVNKRLWIHVMVYYIRLTDRALFLFKKPLLPIRFNTGVNNLEPSCHRANNFVKYLLIFSMEHTSGHTHGA
jgi:hypothetical protein